MNCNTALTGWGSFGETLGRLLRSARTKDVDIAAVATQLRYGMDIDIARQMLGAPGRIDHQSRDAAGTWLTVRWRDRSRKCLRASFHNDRLVDWALY